MTVVRYESQSLLSGPSARWLVIMAGYLQQFYAKKSPETFSSV